VVAIGGIHAGNLGPVVEAGVWGVAVISAVCAADDPRAEAAKLITELETRSSGRAD
jgi:thiamine-phosphate pyrophosphorylase